MARVLGRQEPRVLLRPDYKSQTAGRKAIAMAKSCGVLLYPWQKLLVNVTLATNADGKPAATQVGALVARQNGKGEALLAIGFDSLFNHSGLTLWTTHEFKTTEDAWKRLSTAIRRNPELAARVTKWDGGGAGEHMLEVDGGPEFEDDKGRAGSRIHFVARSKSSGRGFSPFRIIFDEAQQLPVLAYRAMTFATSAQAERQTIFVGTVPDETMDGEIWTSIRDRGRKATTRRLAWLEWSPPHSDDPRTTINPDDVRNVQWSNPSYGYLIQPDTVEDELEASAADMDGYLRERLSVWPNLDAGTGFLDLDKWDNCGTGGLAAWAGEVRLVCEVSQDRKHAVIGVVGPNEFDQPQIELMPPVRAGEVGLGKGTSWVPQRIAEVAADNPDISEIILDSKGQAASLAPAISAAIDQRWAQIRQDAPDDELRLPPEIRLINGREYVAGCGLTYDAINQQNMRHGGGPVMRAAIRAAVKRDWDGIWVWDRRRGGATMAPLVLLTLGIAAMGTEDSYDPANGIAW